MDKKYKKERERERKRDRERKKLIARDTNTGFKGDPQGAGEFRIRQKCKQGIYGRKNLEIQHRVFF
jgi:hypothetical protein